MPDGRRLYEFKFSDGTVVRAMATGEREALIKLGLGQYNPVAYTVRIIEEEKDD